MPSSRHNWILFIDESGDFDDPEEAVVVAGLLVQTYDSPQVRELLRTALRRVYPLAPYPPHAAELNRPVFQAAACLLQDPNGDDAGASRIRAAVQPALTAIHASADEPAQRFLACIEQHRAGAKLKYDTLRNCDDWLLQNHRRTWQMLRYERDRQRDAMVQLLHRVGHECFSGGRCFVVAAWDDGGDGAARCTSDRYLSLLGAALERAFQVIGAASPLPMTWLHVATRDVRRRIATRTNLQMRDLEAEATRASSFPLPLPAGAPGIQFIPSTPAPYDADVHPGLVLADFVANRLRAQVLRHDRRWSEVADASRSRIGLDAEAVPRWSPASVALPAIAAMGAPREAIRLAFAAQEQPLPPLDAPTPRWAADQARVWMAAVTRRRTP